MIPETFQECNEALNKLLEPADQVEFMNLTRNRLIITHPNLGRWIRNHWHLWTDGPLYHNMKSLGFQHPDDMSGTIIKEYWLHLNKLPSEVKKDLVRYDEHWRKINANDRVVFF